MAAGMPPIVILVALCAISLDTMSARGIDMGEKIVVLRKLKNCNDKKILPLQWSDLKITYGEKHKGMFFTLKMKLTREISNAFSMTINFLKCDSSGNPDSCEYLINEYKNDEICKYMVMKNQLWSPFIEHIVEQPKCPIKPGEYRLKNHPISTGFLKFLPVSDALWKVNLKGYDGNVLLSCVDVDLDIKTINRNNRG